MSAASNGGLTSIIVPCYNQRGFTQLCLQALFQHTRPAWELIVVDNGSTDGTGLYLEGVRDAAVVPVTAIANAQNLGFPRAINQGLQAARGEYLVLLNNDAVVTDGWLDQLIALASMSTELAKATEAAGSDGVGVPASAGPGRKIPPEGGTPAGADGDRAGVPASAGPGLTGPPEGGAPAGIGVGPARPAAIGLVGPMSNYAPPPQLVENVPYRDLDEMHAFARRWRNDHRGQWFTAAKLSGFCVLIKRAVYERIGGLDERFGLGLFDDDDLALRARRAGFGLAVAHDLFVHHFGSRTFAGNGIDAERLLEENAARFAAKWGHDAPAGRRVTLRSWGSSARPPIAEAKECCPQMDADERRWEETPTPRIPDFGFRSAEGRPGGVFPGSDAARDIASATDPSSHRRPSASICGQDSSRPVRLPGPRPKVSLTMIVRDEEENLPHCLESVRGIFDEVVVVDTGSGDRTAEIARAFGAKVFEFAWVDDFAAARNAALEHATGDYAFWLDADDVIEPEQRGKLVALLEGLEPALGRIHDRGRKGRLGSTPPPSEPCERISRTRLSSQWSYLQEG